ncbi:uncharacterized protein P7C71_g1512, partial [Lecanoromycetidae sp. Uapishka_2]
MATKQSNHNMNVLKKPLALFSKQPMTGFYRDGYCRVGPEDGGNHAVADESALSNGITMDALKKFAAEPENKNGGGSLDNTVPLNPQAKGGIATETH